ncbi:DUF2789 domain-containing protein [Sedimenticola selenatireducens]|uniref:DUF2789 domain-containing protein n=1 Tax=Sedimenticola selenatireducens TaxID=191960 RepID=A0A2N6CR92_9GAMM|nr:DUF2789 domain-containing protein [Sedimenticola selenatireducens]PLX59580.1 MAG: DUF2789 domain-containing protein [Sedimenticola selenatireducens]
MDTSTHTLSTLFAQLGLPNSEADTNAFIIEHRNLVGSIPLDKAPFWTTAQSSFLREAIEEDSDWAEIVDQLDNSLRK